MASSIELINPKAESVRRAAALQVHPSLFFLFLELTICQVNTTGAVGLANVVKGNLGRLLSFQFFSQQLIMYQDPGVP